MRCARAVQSRPAISKRFLQTYGDMLFRICFVMLGNESDTEDAVQETILKYLQKSPAFETAAHEKAWLITVATNQCRDMLRFHKRHPSVDIDALQAAAPDDESSGIIEALLSLPEKFRIVLTLYYVEEYGVNRIAAIIKRSPSAVKMRLKKGRELLAAKYRKEYL